MIKLSNRLTLKSAIKVYGEWLFYSEGKLIHRQKNLITQSGLDKIAAFLIAENTNSVPWHLAMGTGATAAASTDVKLETEGFRKLISSKQRQGSMARIRTFLITTEAVGTWTEFGLFLAGTGAADGGTLLNRLLPVGGINKTTNQVLTVEVRITFEAG